MSKTITINVSGRKFEVGKNVLSKFPDSTLGQIAASGQTTVTYERPTAMFKCVLAYHQTGHLHVPLSACPGSIQEELAFWGYTFDDLDPCCRRQLKKFHREQEGFMNFEKTFLENTTKYGSCCNLPESCTTRGKQFLWIILDQPFSSIFSKIYYLISTLVILLSILTLFLGTLESFQEALTIEQWKEFYGNDYHQYKVQIDILNGKDDILLLTNMTREEALGDFKLPSHVFAQKKALGSIQTFCAVFFIVELSMRLVCCPNIVRFLKSILNIIDIMAVFVSVSNLLVEYVYPTQRYTATFVDTIGCMQVFRVLRLLRLAKNVTGARVLTLAVSSSYKELCFMSLLIGVNTILFGTLAFSVDAGSMESLPSASWWALITMTTVGYGDIVPKSHAGKFIGALCACMGIIVLALTMPLFVDNFLTFYEYCHEIKHDNAAEKSKKTSPGSPTRDKNKGDKVVAWAE